MDDHPGLAKLQEDPCKPVRIKGRGDGDGGKTDMVTVLLIPLQRHSLFVGKL